VAFIFIFVYFFFVETSGPTLEELAYIFDGPGKKKHISTETQRHKDKEIRTQTESLGECSDSTRSV
jgi:hypothetical protein